MKTFTLFLLAFVMGIGGYALYQQSTVEAAPQVDHANCQARLDNWFLPGGGSNIEAQSDHLADLARAKHSRYLGLRERMKGCW